jgi:hypothetical protein
MAAIFLRISSDQPAFHCCTFQPQIPILSVRLKSGYLFTLPPFGAFGDTARDPLSDSEVSLARARVTASSNTFWSWESNSTVAESTWFEKVLVCIQKVFNLEFVKLKGFGKQIVSFLVC